MASATARKQAWTQERTQERWQDKDKISLCQSRKATVHNMHNKGAEMAAEMTKTGNGWDYELQKNYKKQQDDVKMWEDVVDDNG